MQFLKVLCLYLALYIAQNHWLELSDAWSFQKKVATAETLLERSPLGLKTIHDLKAFGLYRDGVHIEPVPGDEFIGESPGKVGSIRSNDEGHFDILLNKEMSENDIAHALAHEVQHIRDERITQELLQQYPDLEKKIDTATLRLFKGQTSEALSQNRNETFFVLFSLFCTELRAYHINQFLEKDGFLPVNTDVRREGLEQYVMRQYINRHGIQIDSSTTAELSKECIATGDMKLYQQKLLSRLFPELKSPVASGKAPHSKPSSGRDPSSLTAFNL